MIDIDESSLILFFGVAPQPEPEEEREFFAAPSFVKRVGDLELEFSVSAHFADMRITLQRDGWSDPVLELVFPDVVRVVVDRDAAPPILRVTSETRGIAEIMVEPAIAIRVDGSISA